MADKSLFSIAGLSYKGLALKSAIFIACMLITEWLQRDKKHGLELAQVNKWIRRVIYIALIISIVMFAGQNEQFIYFQF
jgi:hypothetical protein